MQSRPLNVLRKVRKYTLLRSAPRLSSRVARCSLVSHWTAYMAPHCEGCIEVKNKRESVRSDAEHDVLMFTTP